MEVSNKTKLSDLINSKNINDIFNGCEKIFCYSYPKKSFILIDKAFKIIIKLFEGKYPGYKACNTQYHNINHTINVFLACLRLIDGYNVKYKLLSEDIVLNILYAALFHDIGYLQEIWDNTGTGAKYTDKHVLRSINFVQKEFKKFMLNDDNVNKISDLINYTDIENDKSKSEDTHDVYVIAGCILGTADIISQMADREYLEKLIFLYHEFKEAGIMGYKTEYDIIKNTLAFYDKVKKRLTNSLNEAYTYALYHFKERYSIQKNLYISDINSNMNYLKKIIEDDSTNFRKKLKRGMFSYINQ